MRIKTESDLVIDLSEVEMIRIYPIFHLRGSDFKRFFGVWLGFSDRVPVLARSFEDVLRAYRYKDYLERMKRHVGYY